MLFFVCSWEVCSLIYTEEWNAVPCAIHILLDFFHTNSSFTSQYKDINQTSKGKWEDSKYVLWILHVWKKINWTFVVSRTMTTTKEKHQANKTNTNIKKKKNLSLKSVCVVSCKKNASSNTIHDKLCYNCITIAFLIILIT